jgi:hypothetical protein
MPFRRAILVTFGLSCACFAAGAQNDLPTDLPKEVLALSRIRQKMRQNLSRLPDYTCVETIERTQRTRGGGLFRPVDTLRLEVLHTGDKELYAWPGSKKFDEHLERMVGGVSSSGEFALHARSVFLGDAQSKYAGEQNIRGRRAMRYDYVIPLYSSGLTLSDGDRHGRVSVRGSFWADAATLDLLRLDVHAENIPPDLPFSAAVSTVDYGRVRISGTDTLLPQSANVELTRTLGAASRNHLQFSQCRSYKAQSEIRYESASEDAGAPAAEKFREFDLPADVSLALRLEHALDSSAAVEGDSITARVEQDVKRKNMVLIPAGAIARGRIRRLESYTDPRPYFIAGLEFLEVESAGQRAAFTGRLDKVDPIPGITWFLSNSKVSENLVHLENIRTEELPGVGTFFVEGARFTLPEGLHMLWKTVDLKK